MHMKGSCLMPLNRKDLFNPTIYKVLNTFKIDKEYVQGEGNYLTDPEGVKYLDFIAQYGAVPFGYNPEFIWEALERVKNSGFLLWYSLPYR